MAEQAVQKQQVIPAVFGSREQAQAAIADLRKHGFSDDDIGIALPQPGKYALPDEEEAGETWKGFVKGAALGAPIGALAGFALFSLVVPGGAAVGLGGALLFALRDGALWGAALGGGLGLYSKIRWNPEEDRWCEIQLGGNDVLVVVRAGQRLEEARRILERHGARCFLDSAQLTEPASTAGTEEALQDMTQQEENMTQGNQNALIAGLNEDLAGEYQAIISYITYAALVGGPDRPELAEFFRAEIADELRHAQFLADKIAALGGEPVVTPMPVVVTRDTREMLEHIHNAEVETIARYRERVSQAESAGDIGLKVRLEEIIADETSHKEEVEKILSMWRS